MQMESNFPAPARALPRGSDGRPRASGNGNSTRARREGVNGDTRDNLTSTIIAFRGAITSRRARAEHRYLATRPKCADSAAANAGGKIT